MRIITDSLLPPDQVAIENSNGDQLPSPAREDHQSERAMTALEADRVALRDEVIAGLRKRGWPEPHREDDGDPYWGEKEEGKPFVSCWIGCGILRYGTPDGETGDIDLNRAWAASRIAEAIDRLRWVIGLPAVGERASGPRYRLAGYLPMAHPGEIEPLRSYEFTGEAAHRWYGLLLSADQAETLYHAVSMGASNLPPDLLRSLNVDRLDAHGFNWFFEQNWVPPDDGMIRGYATPELTLAADAEEKARALHARLSAEEGTNTPEARALHRRLWDQAMDVRVGLVPLPPSKPEPTPERPYEPRKIGEF